MGDISFQQKVFDIIQSVTGEKNVLAVPREFIKLTGDLPSGVFLAQLVYWSDRGSRKDGFIYKTSKEWQEEIFLSDYSLRKARKILESLGLLETKTKKANGNPTVHYKLNREAFINRLFEIQQKESENTTKGKLNINESLTETTPQTTIIKYDKEKRYIDLPIDAHPFFNIYGKHYYNKFSKSHMQITANQLIELERKIDELIGFDIDEEIFTEGVKTHFDNLPKNNNGNIIAFLAASRRYFEVDTD